MEILSAGTHLDICEDASGASPTWRTLYGMSETPDFGGDEEKVEVTNLMDKNVRSIPGIADYGDLEFKFFLNKENERDAENSADIKESYTVLRGYQIAKKQIYYRLVYPDNTGFSWRGSVSVVRNAASVNAALEFTLKTSPSSEVEDIEVN